MLEKGQRLGKYRIVEVLGEGGMATVYRAAVEGPEGFVKEFALKVLSEDVASDSEVVRQFIDEAKIGAVLSHPNIVSVVDFGQVQGAYFIAMELVDGTPLSLVMKNLWSKKRTFSRDAIGYIAAEVLKALSHAHEFRLDGRKTPVIHRDISPENIMVERTGFVKVVDFGIAKAAFASEKTRTGIVKGKLSYIAPEILKGGRATPQSDLFSLGVVMYEMAAGRRLSGDRITREMVEGLETAEDIKSIIVKATSEDPSQRFESASAMLERVVSLGIDPLEGAKELGGLVKKRRSRSGKTKVSKKTKTSTTKATEKGKEVTKQEVPKRPSPPRDPGVLILKIGIIILIILFGAATLLALLGINLSRGG